MTIYNEANRTVKLLLVRHGEREDEAADIAYWDKQEARWNSIRQRHYKYAKIDLTTAISKKLISPESYPVEDRLDPLLTKEGHKQAQASFQAISKALPKESRVAVFSSPLRRAIGTSLMLGTVPFDRNILWSSPANDGTDTGSGDFPAPSLSEEESLSLGRSHHQGSRVIPITVLNQLGDFASRVHKHGGTKVLVPQGLIRCGAMPSKDGYDERIAFTEALYNMPSHCGVPNKNTSLVEFWTPDGMRMSDAIDPRTKTHRLESAAEKNEKIESQQVSFNEIRKERKTLHRFRDISRAPPKPDPIEAVNEAIRMTATRGCDTCIIVAHREGIRDLQEACNVNWRARLPYCAIGSFGATLSSTTPSRTDVSYNFWYVWPFQKFGKHSIPKPIPYYRGILRLMSYVKGEVRCICCINTSSWGVYLPGEVWLSSTKYNSPRLQDLNTPIEAEVTNERDHKVLNESFVDPMAARGRLLFFDSLVYFDTLTEGVKYQKYRFRISRREVFERKVSFWCKQIFR